MEGCRARKVPDKKSEKVWDHMEQFAGYGFNKSHSAAYAWLAYQTAYLKANYPPYFMAALLTSERANTDKMVQYIGECREMGIDVLPPDANQSTMFFTVVDGDGGRCQGAHPLRSRGDQERRAKGPWRPSWSPRRKEGSFRSLFDFCERVDTRAVNRRVIESFVKSGCFDCARFATFVPVCRHRPRQWSPGRRGSGTGHRGSRASSACSGGTKRPTLQSTERVPDVPDWPEGERLGFEKESLGFFITGHPLERFREELAQWATGTTGRIGELAGAPEVSVGGIVTALRLLKTKKGDRMATFFLEDLEGSAEVLVFPETFKKVATRLADDLVVLVKGKARDARRGAAPTARRRRPPPRGRQAAGSPLGHHTRRSGTLGRLGGRASQGYTRWAPWRLPRDVRTRSQRIVLCDGGAECALQGAARSRVAFRDREPAGSGSAPALAHQRRTASGLLGKDGLPWVL